MSSVKPGISELVIAETSLSNDESAGSRAIGVSDEPQYKVYKRRWIGILSLVLMNICTSWGWLTFAAISSDSAEYFGMATQTSINWLSTVILFSFLVASPAVWYTLVHRNIKWALIASSVLAVVGNWLRYAGTTKKLFGLVMFGQILIGFAQPFALSSPAYYTDIWFTSSSRVSANALASLANPLGGAIAQLVGPAIVTKPSQLPTFVLVTAIVTSACSVVSFFVPTHPPLPPCPSSSIPKLSLKETFSKLFKSLEFFCVWAMFSIYVGFFNSFSTYTNQIMVPYGYTTDQAGIAGAVLIVSGIVFAAVVSPIIDRTHKFHIVIMIQVPLIAAAYVAAIFMSTTSKQLVGPYLVSAVLGATSFSLLPIFLEWIQEQTSPADPAVSSSLLWAGGEFFGGIFIIVMNALKYPADEGNPPGNMRRALIFEAVVACVGVLPLWIVRRPLVNARIHMDSGR